MLAPIISALVQALTLVVLADVVLSWVAAGSRIKQFTSEITAPLYAPVHAILRPEQTGGLDFAPMIIIFGAQALGNVLIGLSY